MSIAMVANRWSLKVCASFALAFVAFFALGASNAWADPSAAQAQFTKCIGTAPGTGDRGTEGVSTGAITTISGAVGTIAKRASTIALNLFRLLITVEVAWFLLKLVSKRSNGADISTFFSDIGFHGITVLVMLGIIQYAGDYGFIQGIFDKFGAMALDVVSLPGGGAVPIASGLTHVNSGVGGLMNMGGCMGNYVLTGATDAMHFSIWSMDLSIIFAIFVDLIAAILIGLAYYIIAAQLFVTLIESSLIGSAGVVILGFMGSRWTLPFAQGYIKFIFASAIKIFVTFLVAAFGSFLATQLIANLNTGFGDPTHPIGSQFQFAFGLIGLAILMIYLAVRLPSTAATLISGSPDMGFGTLAATAAAVGGAAVAATMGAKSLGGALAEASAPRPAGVIAPGGTAPPPPKNWGARFADALKDDPRGIPGSGRASKISDAAKKVAGTHASLPHGNATAGPSIEIGHHRP